MNTSTRQPLSVAFVLGQNGVGGTELQAQSLIQALTSVGVSVDVFVIDGRAGLAGLPEESTEILSNGSRGAFSTITSLTRACFRLRKRLRTGNYDVVHSAMARAYVLTAVATIGWKTPRRVTWRRNLGVHLGRHKLAFKLMERLALRQSHVIVVNSQDVRDYWLALAGPRAASKFMIVPNMLADWRFEPVEPARGRTDRIRILAVGALKVVKGHSMLIEAVGSSPRLREISEVIIVGAGDERQALMERAKALGVDLHLVGQVDDPRPWLYASDLFVQSSLSEGSSNAVAEAMAAGMAIVATDVGGMRELLGDAGDIVKPANAQALGEALCALIDDPSARSRLGTRARERAAALASRSDVINQYLHAYGAESPCAESSGS